MNMSKDEWHEQRMRQREYATARYYLAIFKSTIIKKIVRIPVNTVQKHGSCNCLFEII